jgi:hypothetical protein
MQAEFRETVPMCQIKEELQDSRIVRFWEKAIEYRYRTLFKDQLMEN